MDSLLPELIARGLAANDRLKYYLALLQAAQARAQAPQQPAANLRVQREASGVADASLDRVVESSSDRGNHTTYIPGACLIIDRLFEELRRMQSVLEAAGPARPTLGERAALYSPTDRGAQRLSAVLSRRSGHRRHDQRTGVALEKRPRHRASADHRPAWRTGQPPGGRLAGERRRRSTRTGSRLLIGPS